MKCIICEKEISNLSEEHILPDSLGGKLKIKSVCKQCNSDLGRLIDSKFLDDDLIAIIRDKFKIPNKNGDLIDLSKHFSKRLIDCDTNKNAKFKIQNLDGENRVYVVEPEQDILNINFDNNKVIFNNISDLDTLTNMVDKKVKFDGYSIFNKNDFKNAIKKNFKYKLIMKKFYTDVYYNINNYYPESIKIVYEVLYSIYNDKFINTIFAKSLKNKIQSYLSKKTIDFSNDDYLTEILLVIDKLEDYKGKNIVNMLISRNVLNNDVCISINFYNAIVFTIFLPERNELNFIDERTIKLN